MSDQFHQTNINTTKETVRFVTTTATLETSDASVLILKTGVAYAVTLPDSKAAKGQAIDIAVLNQAGSNVTLTAVAGDTINAAGTLVLDVAGGVTGLRIRSCQLTAAPTYGWRIIANTVL